MLLKYLRLFLSNLSVWSFPPCLSLPVCSIARVLHSAACSPFGKSFYIKLLQTFQIQYLVRYKCTFCFIICTVKTKNIYLTYQIHMEVYKPVQHGYFSKFDKCTQTVHLQDEILSFAKCKTPVRRWKKREGIITKMNNEKHGIDTGFTLRPIKHMYQIIENCNKSKRNNWSNSI